RLSRALSAPYAQLIHRDLSLFYQPLTHLDLHSYPTRRSSDLVCNRATLGPLEIDLCDLVVLEDGDALLANVDGDEELTFRRGLRSEEHTSELQSPDHLVCRLLLEKKNTTSYCELPTRNQHGFK